jgi:predicted PolB exonuclease-like 3'-5' exonuclease
MLKYTEKEMYELLEEDHTVQRLINVLTIDIETIPDGNKLTIEEMMPLHPKTMSKEDTIRKWAAANIDTEFRSRSLNSLKGRLLCIGVKWNDEPTVVFRYHEDESKMIKEFGDYLASKEKDIHACAIVGHNVRGFDNPWLVQRGFKYQNKDIIRLMVTNKRDYRLQDTNALFTLGVYGAYVKLKDMCEFLGVPTSKDDIDGSEVYDVFLKGDLDRIYDYCSKDVDATYSCYLKMQP